MPAPPPAARCPNPLRFLRTILWRADMCQGVFDVRDDVAGARRAETAPLASPVRGKTGRRGGAALWATRIGAFVIAFVSAATDTARAASPTSPSIDEALESPAGDPCLTRAALVDGISHWLHREDVGGMLRVRVHGSSDSEVRFEIEREGRTVERVFDARGMSCTALRGVVTFSIAVAIESALRELRAEARPEPSTVDAEAEAAPNVAVQAAPHPPKAPKARGTEPKRTERVHLSLDEVVLLGNPPGMSLGVAPGIARPFGGGWGLAAGALMTTGSAPFTVGDATVRAWLTLGWARACRDVPSPSTSLGLALCAGGAAGSMSVRGYDPTSGRSSSLFWGAVHVRGELTVPIVAALSLRFGVGPELILARPSIVVLDPATNRPRYRVTTSAGALSFSVGLSFAL